MARRLELRTKISDRPAHAIRLRQLRVALDWSQAQLAQELGVSPGAINFWEQGKRGVPGPVIKLVEILEKRRSQS